jgi:hypothetical protein
MITRGRVKMIRERKRDMEFIKKAGSIGGQGLMKGIRKNKFFKI